MSDVRFWLLWALGYFLFCAVLGGVGIALLELR